MYVLFDVHQKYHSPALLVHLIPTQMDVLVREDRRHLLEELPQEVEDGVVGGVHGAVQAVGVAAAVALGQDAGVAKLPGFRMAWKIIKGASVPYVLYFRVTFLKSE